LKNEKTNSKLVGCRYEQSPSLLRTILTRPAATQTLIRNALARTTKNTFELRNTFFAVIAEAIVDRRNLKRRRHRKRRLYTDEG
jgi:hypothetical protein